MRKTHDNPKTLPVPPAQYSNVVKLELGDVTWLFLAGMVAFDVDGSIVGKDDFVVHAEKAFSNIQAALEAHGAAMSDVVKTTTYLTDIANMDHVKAMRERFFPANPPTSTTVQVSALALPDLHVEIEVVAALAR